MRRNTLKPVGHQSTNWIALLFLMVEIVWLTSFGTTSPNKIFVKSLFRKHKPTSIEQTHRHVLAILWITLHHLIGSLKAQSSDFRDRERLMVSLVGRNERCIGDQWKMDSRIWNEVGLNDSLRILSLYKKYLTWNSLRSTFKAPSKRSEAVMEETTLEY